jgi:hypothetical protein
VDLRAVDVALGRFAPASPDVKRPGSLSMPPGSLPWRTPEMCADTSGFVSGFPTLMPPYLFPPFVGCIAYFHIIIDRPG